MAKFDEQDITKGRYGLAIKKLIDKNKRLKLNNDKKGIETRGIDYSYGTIASSTGLRPATISNIINGVSDIKGNTLQLLLRSLGVSMSQFGKVFDCISDDEVITYLNN